MRIRLLGQAGVQIDLQSGLRVVLDPYLSDSLRECKGERFARMIPLPENIEALCPDVLAITHDHGDHLDMQSLEHWLNGDHKLQILGTYPVYKQISSRWQAKHNVMVMRPGVEVTLGNARFCAVPASHKIEDAVGYLLRVEGRTLYFSGDTLYCRQIPEFLKKEHIDIAFVCINGFGNNMNAWDAARLTQELRPGLVVPVHWDMFAPFGADPADFLRYLHGVPAKVLRAYEEIELRPKGG